MDVTYLNQSESSCRNVFVHGGMDELQESFTELWVQLINSKENNRNKNVILQTDTFEL